MKKFRKIISLIVAMVMVLAMTGQAFAAETGSITINNAVNGQKYTIYRIFDLESYNAESNAYAYKVNSAWSNFIGSDSVADVYVSVDAQGYVTWVENADATEFAKLALQYAKDNGIENQGQATAADEKAEFSNLVLGYYLVDSSLGALCALDTTNPNVTMLEKNEAATNEKQVQEDSTNNYGKVNDADLEQTITFKSTITAQAGAENYVLHDRMDSGLTFGEITEITLNDDPVPAIDPTDDEYNYVIAYNVEHDDGTCAFEVRFTEKFCETLTAGAEIVVTYTGSLNESAVIGSTGNENTSWLTYGDSNKTTDSVTTTCTWDVEIFKYTLNATEEKVALGDAVFTLSTSADGSNSIKFADKGNNTYRVDPEGLVSQIKTDETGTFTIEGLDSAVYYLTEITAPNGYNKLAGPVQFKITSEGSVELYNTVDETYVEANRVEVLNNTGTELPSTGGIGTTIFYAAGIILMSGAVFFVVRRKRA